MGGRSLRDTRPLLHGIEGARALSEGCVRCSRGAAQLARATRALGRGDGTHPTAMNRASTLPAAQRRASASPCDAQTAHIAATPALAVAVAATVSQVDDDSPPLALPTVCTPRAGRASGRWCGARCGGGGLALMLHCGRAMRDTRRRVLGQCTATVTTFIVSR